VPCLMKTLPEKSTSMRPFSSPGTPRGAGGGVGRRRPGAPAHLRPRGQRVVDLEARRLGEAGDRRVLGHQRRGSRDGGSCPRSAGHRRAPAPGLRPGVAGRSLASVPRGAMAGGPAEPGRPGGPCCRRRPAPIRPLQPLHHDVGAGLPVLVDRVLVPVQLLVDRAQVEVDPGVALRELQRLQEGRLRVLQAAQLEADEAQVVVEGVGVGALRDELAVDLLGLVQLLPRK
jgi:hypothetical protein